ncbi:MAG TPA: hypothetical protein VIV15_02045 [Anaerolineales bacterium]
MALIEKADPAKSRDQCKRENRPAAEDNAAFNIQFGEPTITSIAFHRSPSNLNSLANAASLQLV